jgi:hypothetical protein
MKTRIEVTDLMTGCVAVFRSVSEAYRQAAYLVSLGHEVQFNQEGK